MVVVRSWFGGREGGKGRVVRVGAEVWQWVDGGEGHGGEGREVLCAAGEGAFVEPRERKL